MTPEEIIVLLREGHAKIAIQENRGRGRAKAMLTTSNGIRTEVFLTIRLVAKGEQATIGLYGSQPQWSTEELTTRGLPLYWSRNWLSRQLMSHKSFADIERTTGYKRATLQRWTSKHKLGNPRHEAIRRDYRTGAYPTKQALADHYDITIPTLNRILRG